MGYNAARMSDAPTAGGSHAEAQSPSLVGQILDGRYRITRKLGEGGMGEVYAAEHVHIEKKFAIKLLRPEILSNPEAVTRFRQEARSSSSIGHRNIIAIEDFGQLPDNRIYMCMELLNGAALNDMITQPMPVDRLLNILIQTGHGLAAAHAKHIVHRDMKPENIFVTIGPNGEDIPKLLDFGIAKVAGNDGANNLTKTGMIFGTPFYMAPEQALGNPVDARTDIYAVGVIMYECFSGSLPFQGDSFMGILTQHITAEPEPVAQRASAAGRQLPPGLADVITRCMQKNPAHRFATMDELVNVLIQIYRGLVGPGMSTYMEAFPVVPTAAHQIQPTPQPMTGPYQVGQSQAVPAVPSGPSGSQPVLMQPGQSGVYSGSTAASSVFQPPRKSKTGLVIAILAVLAVGGGVAAFAIVSSQGGGGKGSGSQVASNDPGSAGKDPGSGHVVTPPPVTVDAAVATVTPDAAEVAGTDPGPGSNPGPGSGSDAGSGHEPAGSNAPPPVAVVEVPLFGRNVGAFEVWENGAKIADGPGMIEVPKGEQRTVVIKARGFKDKSVTIDGIAKKKVQFSLSPIPVVHDPHDHVTPQPPPTDCTNSLRDPSNQACRKQYCATHENEPKCLTI
jgi:serine/threonine-protein kinase